MKISIAICALLMSASASGAGMPPEKYEHAYKGNLFEKEVPLKGAAKECNKLGKRFKNTEIHPERKNGRPLYGCAYPRKGECYIVYSYDPSGNDKDMASNVRRHEIAHCNGWPADHPGSR